MNNRAHGYYVELQHKLCTLTESEHEGKHFNADELQNNLAAHFVDSWNYIEPKYQRMLKGWFETFGQLADSKTEPSDDQIEAFITDVDKAYALARSDSSAGI